MFNVLLITIDSLRADCSGWMDRMTKCKTLASSISKPSEKPYVFLNAIAPSTHTSPSFLSILSGNYPSRYGDWFSAYSNERTIISEIFSQNGYQTCAINSNPYISRAFNFNRGFDFFEDNLRYRNTEGTKKRFDQNWRKLKGLFKQPYEPGYNISHQALEWLRNKSETKPYFLWVHYMDVHGPYITEEDQSLMTRISAALLWHKALNQPEKMTQEDITRFKRSYMKQMKFIEWYTNDLLSEIDLLDTVVIITADHGDFLGEHGFFGHKFALYEEILHIPLLIKLPSSIDLKGREISGSVSTMDILPTLVDLLGLQGENVFDGESLCPLLRDKYVTNNTRYIISEVSRKHLCVRRHFWKLIVDYSRGNKELYNLEEDPQEHRNLYLEMREISSELEDIISYHLDECKVDSISPKQMSLDNEIKERLRALGYI